HPDDITSEYLQKESCTAFFYSISLCIIFTNNGINCLAGAERLVVDEAGTCVKTMSFTGISQDNPVNHESRFAPPRCP
ncbi:MAG TPA: hypothetical protein PKN13_12725, partial [Accumulibacter sp.]|nr:hypothetical protein [Accumulibacter sp.]HMW18619.1 hypothetical protein [Accumulibacter sp.]HMY07344.1 hypothetical protein [Accumulibacter sp.]HNG39078.1 hypothetical protein [Accumulibacter sp.]HNI72386.1 hypothetical protein [Accumulibacter sp.]